MTAARTAVAAATAVLSPLTIIAVVDDLFRLAAATFLVTGILAGILYLVPHDRDA